jgi:HNH endonuclease
VPSKLTIEERFWAKVAIAGPDECWLWTGGATRRGYGAFAIRHGKMVIASRFAWELVRGPIPPGLCVLHRCDNPPCCNPTHLWLGTKRDNSRDMVAKGRGGTQTGVQALPRGEDNAAAKLSAAQVVEIRLRRARGEKIVPLAKEFGVTHALISAICLRRIWKHVA